MQPIEFEVENFAIGRTADYTIQGLNGLGSTLFRLNESGSRSLENRFDGNTRTKLAKLLIAGTSSSKRLVTTMSDIAAWLKEIGLGKYTKVFAENDIDFDIITQLGEPELKELGISLGDRKRLLKGIAALEVESVPAANTISDTPASVAPKPQAERRQLTVMFVDLIGSTALSGQLDLEELSVIMRRYQNTVSGEVNRLEGFIAKFMGDGVLAYFGWPRAHEDAAERAVRAGLAITAEVAKLRTPDGQALATRIGIATGLVVVGELIGEGSAQEETVIGETPNLAARLQDLAKPNAIVISSLTKDLAGDDFLYDNLGIHELKGITGQVKAWGVTDERALKENESTGDERPLIGRQEELGLLRRAWSQSREGVGQVVLISGEPGIGKSRLVEAIGAEAKAEGHARITIRCSPYHTNSALYPVIQYLQRLLIGQHGDNGEQKRIALEQILADYENLPDNSLPLLAVLLSLPLPEERYPALTLTMSPQQQKQQTLDVLVAWMNDAAERQSAIWVWEDLHWADPSTLELLALAIEQCPTAPILHVLTYRPDFTPPWPLRTHMTPLTLNRLERTEVEALITRHAGGKTLPGEVIEHIVAKTDGVPLYVEELTKAIVSADFLHEVDDHYELIKPLSDTVIPVTLQDSLMARLDRGPSVRQVAQLGAVFGREFAYERLQALASLKESVLRESLGHLVEEELLYQRGRPPQARYIFKHALIQDMAYQSLLKRTRQQYHRQIAELYQAKFPELGETQPELLAHHYTEAGLAEQAIDYWQRAGQHASDHSAYQEALGHLQTGLDLIQSLPDSRARDRQELALQTALGTASLIVRGQSVPEVEVAYARARILCQRLGDTQDSPLILFGLWRFYVARPDFPMAHQLAQELHRLAENGHEAALTVMAHYALSVNGIWSGELRPGYKHAQAVIAHYSVTQRSSPLFRAGQDPGVTCHIYAALALWLLGYPEQAVASTHDALALATELDDPISNAVRLGFSAMIWQFRRQAQDVYDHAEAAVTLCSAHGFNIWLRLGTILPGWALTHKGQQQEGVDLMHQGITNWRASGSVLVLPYFLTLLAAEYQKIGRIEAGLKVLNEAQDVTLRTGQYWWQAEIHRLQGEWHLQQTTPNFPGVERYFQQALDVARQQQAKSLELRAATSYAHLWQNQGKRQQAYDLLAPIYGWFTEGFDTADLKDAKALLDELA